MDRCILHLDIDAFLASVEQIVEPALRGKPVVVGSGCVASRSYEAKARGIQTAMAMVEARRLCPELVVRDGDARRAERFRRKVAQVVRGFVPRVQVCSLDDMYGELSGVDPRGTWRDYALQIRDAVRAATGLWVSQGIGTSKVVARIATRHGKPRGVHVVAPGDEVAFVGAHALEDLPGIGPQTRELFGQWNLATVGDLQRIERDWLERALGKRGVQLYWRARGLDGDPRAAAVAIEPELGAHSISRETSFEPVAGDEAGRSFVRGMLAYLLDRAAAELRAQRWLARTVQVRLRHVDQVGAERSRSLPQATARTDLLFELAAALLESLWTRRVLVRLVGVTLAGLAPRPRRQATLFTDGGQQRDELFAAVDRVRARHGFGKLVAGAAAALLGRVAASDAGFVLRTPSLTR
jgi:DNA polymerase-4